MNRYFFKNTAFLFVRSKIFNLTNGMQLFLLATLISLGSFSGLAQTDNATTLVVEKDIFPKITDRKERQIKGKDYLFATINEKKGMVALPGNFLDDMTQAAGVELADFLMWNDLNPTDEIKTGQVYYLEKKNNKAKETATHVLLPNETLWDVSQKYAIRYKYLLKFNRLKESEQPKAGLVVWLQTKRPKNVPAEIKDVTPIVASFEEQEDEPADPELMAEWEELKKTELADLENEETSTSLANSQTKNNNAASSESSTDKEIAINQQAVLIEEKPTTVTQDLPKYHIVQEGESLYDIAEKYNLMMSTLKKWNDLPEYTTYTGQKLVVSPPNQKDKTFTDEATSVTPNAAGQITQKNDTNTGTNGKTTIKAQNPDGTFITLTDSSGVLLPVPEDTFIPIAPLGVIPDYHIVQKDETLWAIARKYGLNPTKLIFWNGYVKGDNIDVGTKIVLKEHLAYPPGSREMSKQNSSSFVSSQREANPTTGTTTFQDPTLVAETGATTQDATSKKPTREKILAAGGDPDKAGTPGYDEMGFPAAGASTMTTSASAQETTAKIYVIQPKDVLSKIAKRFNTTTKDLIAWNPNKITLEGKIFKGDTIFVSDPNKIAREQEQTMSSAVYPPDSSGAGYHVVQPNESIYEISDKYNVTMASIRKWNNLSPTTKEFPVGTKLIISEEVFKLQQGNQENKNVSTNSQASQTTSALKYTYHVVRKGETLFSVASKYGISTAQLREWNNRQGDLLYEGEKLIVGIK